MYTYYDPYTTLYHFGIKGQKWGVRRYQNYDGTYTQKGLARYRKSQEDYEKAKASGDKKATKAAKKQMNADYKQLKTDYMADKGRELAAEGKTITDTEAKRFKQTLGVALGSAVVSYAASKGKQYILTTKSGKNINLNAVSAVTAGIGANVINAALNMKADRDIKNLRAYYNHRVGRK